MEELVSLTRPFPQAKALTLGFLKREKKQDQRANYCEFKPEFLLSQLKFLLTSCPINLDSKTVRQSRLMENPLHIFIPRKWG